MEPLLDEPLEVVARVEAAEGGYRLRLSASTTGRRGERVIDVGSCSEAIRAATLLIALAIDPSFEAERATETAASAAFPLPSVDAEAGTVPSSEPRGQVVDAEPPNPQAKPSPEPRPHHPSPPKTRRKTERGRPAPSPVRGGSGQGLGADLGGEARLSVGDLPRAAAGLGVVAGLTLPKDALRLVVAGYPLQKDEIRVNGSEAGQSVFMGADLALFWCRDLVPRGTRFGPCLGGHVAVVRGNARRIAQDMGSGNALLLGPTLGASGSIATGGPVRILTDAHLHWLPAAPRFVVNPESDQQEVHRPSPIGAVFGLGAAIDLR